MPASLRCAVPEGGRTRPSHEDVHAHERDEEQHEANHAELGQLLHAPEGAGGQLTEAIAHFAQMRAVAPLCATTLLRAIAKAGRAEEPDTPSDAPEDGGDGARGVRCWNARNTFYVRRQQVQFSDRQKRRETAVCAQTDSQTTAVLRGAG